MQSNLWSDYETWIAQQAASRIVSGEVRSIVVKDIAKRELQHRPLAGIDRKIGTLIHDQSRSLQNT